MKNEKLLKMLEDRAKCLALLKSVYSRLEIGGQPETTEARRKVLLESAIHFVTQMETISKNYSISGLKTFANAQKHYFIALLQTVNQRFTSGVAGSTDWLRELMSLRAMNLEGFYQGQILIIEELSKMEEN
jgi:hypothetical protein